MKIEGLGKPLGFEALQKQQKNSTEESGFKDVLSSFVEQTQKSSAEANKLTKEFIVGGDVELHEVMIAAEKAKTDVMLLSEIRNKALDTYRELTRMQI